MFETSVVREHIQPARRRISFLTLSFVAHTAVIVGAVAASVATVEFPTNTPDETALAPQSYVFRVPPPLGTPDGGAKPQAAAPPKAATPPPRPNEVVAPQTIPETIVPATGPGTAVDAPSGSGSESGPVGVPWGVEGSIGDLDAPPVTGTFEPVEQKIYEVRGEVKSPRLVHRVEPSYPSILLRTRMKATVVVRCVIDRNGRVRDPQIVAGALPPFNEAVLSAVRQWRFTPGSLRGEAVETYLDLTVNFSVK